MGKGGRWGKAGGGERQEVGKGRRWLSRRGEKGKEKDVNEEGRRAEEQDQVRDRKSTIKCLDAASNWD